MKEYLKKKYTFKIFALFFGVLLFIYVSDSLNPMIRKDISVPLRIDNEHLLKQKKLSLISKNFPRNITVSVNGRTQKINSLTSNHFDAILDLGKINDINKKVLYVDVYLDKNKQNEGITIENNNPRTVEVEVEQIGENPFRVEVITTGNLKKSYKIHNIATTPEVIPLEVTSSAFKDVGSVKVYIDVTNFDSDLYFKKQYIVLDKSGKEIEQFRGNEPIDIKIEIAKEIPIIPFVKGKPDNNYIDGLRTVSPAKALVTGPKEVLYNLEEIKTTPIDIDGATQNISNMVSLNIPNGVTLVDTPTDVLTTVVIKKLSTKTLTIDAKDIKLVNSNKDDFNYSFMPKQINLEISGIIDELNNLNIKNIIPTIDVSNLLDGTYTASLKLTLPGTVKIAQLESIEVIIAKIQ